MKHAPILLVIASIAVLLAISVMVFETFTKHKRVIRGIRRDHQRAYVREQLGLDLDDESFVAAVERREELRRVQRMVNNPTHVRMFREVVDLTGPTSGNVHEGVVVLGTGFVRQP